MELHYPYCFRTSHVLYTYRFASLGHVSQTSPWVLAG